MSEANSYRDRVLNLALDLVNELEREDFEGSTVRELVLKLHQAVITDEEEGA